MEEKSHESKEDERERIPKKCPRCGHEGSGPYPRWVLNAAKKRYEPYYYFAHRSGGKTKWCYLGRNPRMSRVLDKEPRDTT